MKHKTTQLPLHHRLPSGSPVVATAALFLSLGFLSACSGSGSGNSVTLPLPGAALVASSGCTKLSDTDGAKVYQCKDDASENPLFVTVLRDCSISEKFSHRATTRQLLVGFSHLKVLNQEPVALGEQKVLRSVVAGILDVEPVYVSTFTLRNGSCVTDLVIWTKSEEASRATVGTLGIETVAQRFSDSSTHLAQKFGAQDIFPAGPSTPPETPASIPTLSALTAVPKEAHHAELPTG